MSRIKRNRRRVRRAGFTLLEVMLVVGLLALLAAMVIPNLMKKNEQAKIDLTQSQIGPSGSIASEIKSFQMDTGKFPESLKDLSEKPSDEDTAKKWRGPYIENPDNLQDPWGHQYQYAGGTQAKHNEGRFDLYSIGPDGQEGTEDDIVNWKRDK